MKNIITIFALIGCSLTYGQQEGHFTQFDEVKTFYNPASTGVDGYPKLTSIFRKQWAGLEGSPQTGFFMFESPIKNTNMALGGYVTNDRIGVTNLAQTAVNYAYKVQIGESYLSFGINAGLDYYYAQLDKLDYWDINDQVFASNISGRVLPHIGTGTYFYTDRFYAGLSVPRLINVNSSSAINLNVNLPATLDRHYYFVTGYEAELSSKFTLTPTALVKYVPHAPVQGDIGLKTTYNQTLSFGVVYRTLGAFGAVTQFNFQDQLKIGYSVDFSTTAIRNFSNGTHEILITYEFGKAASTATPSLE